MVIILSTGRRKGCFLYMVFVGAIAGVCTIYQIYFLSQAGRIYADGWAKII